MRDKITTYDKDTKIADLKKLFSGYRTIKNYPIDVYKPNSRLIQSLLYRLPIKETIIFVQDMTPPFNFYPIHGEETFATIINFYNNRFKLSGVDATFNGKYFDDLINLLQSRLDNTLLNIKVIETSLPVTIVCDLLDIDEAI